VKADEGKAGEICRSGLGKRQRFDVRATPRSSRWRELARLLRLPFHQICAFLEESHEIQ
jgi:hypothetical protein